MFSFKGSLHDQNRTLNRNQRKISGFQKWTFCAWDCLKAANPSDYGDPVSEVDTYTLGNSRARPATNGYNIRRNNRAFQDLTVTRSELLRSHHTVVRPCHEEDALCLGLRAPSATPQLLPD
jgi:hypothetical protein